MRQALRLSRKREAAFGCSCLEAETFCTKTFVEKNPKPETLAAALLEPMSGNLREHQKAGFLVLELLGFPLKPRSPKYCRDMPLLDCLSCELRNPDGPGSW